MALVKYSTGGGIVIDEGKMLLLDRPKRKEIRLPKGHIETGETPDVTAVRETVEETGYTDLEIVADLGESIVEFDHNDDHYVRTEHYFLMRLLSKKQRKRDKTDEAQFRPIWSPLTEAPQVLTFEAERRVAQFAIQQYQKG
ncbi:MAG: NUDIX domain-containing protein [Caldilineaceae bacterium]